MAAPLDVDLKALAALVSASFGAIALAGGPRSRPNQLLCVFLLLIAGNQAAETMRSLAADEAGRLVWFRAATVFAAIDPFVLAWFASHLRGGAWLHRLRILLPLLAVSGVFALWGATVSSIPSGIEPLPLLLSTYTAAVYLTLAFVLSVAAIRTEGPERGRLVLVAFSVAAVPVVAFAGVGVAVHGVTMPLAIPEPESFGVDLAATLLAATLATLALAHAARKAAGSRADARRVVLPMVAAVACVTAIQGVGYAMGALLHSSDVEHAYAAVGRATAPPPVAPLWLHHVLRPPSARRPLDGAPRAAARRAHPHRARHPHGRGRRPRGGAAPRERGRGPPRRRGHRPLQRLPQPRRLGRAARVRRPGAGRHLGAARGVPRGRRARSRRRAPWSAWRTRTPTPPSSPAASSRAATGSSA